MCRGFKEVHKRDTENNSEKLILNCMVSEVYFKNNPVRLLLTTYFEKTLQPVLSV